jgi:Ca-activated chloride channel family protein
LTAAEVAQTLNVKVYTIGIGIRGMAPMPVGKDPFTGQVITRPMPADVDEDTLQKIAGMTGGKYYRADSAEIFRRIYAEIDRMEKSEAEVKKFQHYDELFAPVTLTGLACFLLELILNQTVWRKLP